MTQEFWRCFKAGTQHLYPAMWIVPSYYFDLLHSLTLTKDVVWYHLWKSGCLLWWELSTQQTAHSHYAWREKHTSLDTVFEKKDYFPILPLVRCSVFKISKTETLIISHCLTYICFLSVSFRPVTVSLLSTPGPT